MEIYFIDTEIFLKTFGEESTKLLSEFLGDMKFRSEKRRKEYCFGRFLLQYVLRNRYGVENPEIVVEDKKPRLKDLSVHFSLSHSKNIVLAAFDDAPVGVDIEFMKERDFKSVLAYFKIDSKVKNKEDFYRFWTAYEAKIKLQSEPVSFYTTKFEDDFMLTACSGKKIEIEKNLKIVEIQQMADTIIV